MKFFRTSKYGAIAGVTIATMFAGTSNTFAQWQPTETITLVSQSSAGTGNDLLLRKLAEIWTKNNMVPVSVENENVTGGSGENARRYVSSENSGNAHMLYAYTPGTLNQTILSNSEYTWDKFTPIAMLVNVPVAVVVNADSPFQSVDDLVEASKKDKASVIMGGGSYGGTPSVVGAMIAESAGIEHFPYTPFKGGGEALTELLGNHIHFTVASPPSIKGFVENGQMRVLAATEKLDVYPDVPTLAEEGYDVNVAQFRIIVAPPDIPAEAAAYYTDLLKKTLETPEWQEYSEASGFNKSWKDGPDALAYLDSLADTYRIIDKKMGLLKN